MTLQEVVHSLLLHLRIHGKGMLSWNQVQEWPEGAIAVFEEAGWIKPVEKAKIVECPGCEENCYQTVHFQEARNERPCSAFVICDRRADMGRVSVPMQALQCWQITTSQIASWVIKQVDLRYAPKMDVATSTFQLGSIFGTKHKANLQLVVGNLLSLMVDAHSVLLEEIILITDNQLLLDRGKIQQLIDLPSHPGSGRYKPSTVRREAGKLETQDRNKKWQQAYHNLRSKYPGKTMDWYAKKIEAMHEINPNGRNFRTIKKNMEKKII